LDLESTVLNAPIRRRRGGASGGHGHREKGFELGVLRQGAVGRTPRQARLKTHVGREPSRRRLADRQSAWATTAITVARRASWRSPSLGSGGAHATPSPSPGSMRFKPGAWRLQAEYGVSPALAGFVSSAMLFRLLEGAGAQAVRWRHGEGASTPQDDRRGLCSSDCWA
jgi:hypothetical protein